MAAKKLGVVALVGATAVLFLFTPAGRAVSQSLQEVFVVNFPDRQKVEGSVVIDGAVHLAELKAIRDLLVPPVGPTETTRLVDGGVLVTEGFPSIVLSLHGSVRGEVKQQGDVGVFLIPDEESIQQAFNEQGMMHFILETRAPGVSAQTPYFASTQPRYNVAFPRYRVLLYNTTDKSVNVNLFAYLTN